MSGHSKWHTIKHKKGAADAKRGKIFTRHAKLITITTRDGGADPEMNPPLRTAIANAKADNVPNANIEKAIAKGTGADKDALQFVEIMYEGYGPAGTAFYVQALTDNRNRSATNVKIIFNKNGGHMAEAGSVGWMFDRKGLIFAKAAGIETDEAELLAIDAGAQDISFYDDLMQITTEPTELMKVREALIKNGFNVEKAEISYLPKNTVAVTSKEDADKVLKLIDLLEDDEDVSTVFSNCDIPEEFLD